MDIAFDSIKHEYRVFGEVQPSVTQILGLANSYEFVDKQLLEKACHFGTAVHRATELYDQKLLNISTLDVALIPYLEGWKKFLNDTKFKILDCEFKVASKRGYAGTLDRIGYLNDELTVLDIKTGSVIPKTTALQLAAYRGAYQEMTGKPIAKRICVKLKPMDYSITIYDNDYDFQIFLNFLTVHQWVNAK